MKSISKQKCIESLDTTTD